MFKSLGEKVTSIIPDICKANIGEIKEDLYYR